MEEQIISALQVPGVRPVEIFSGFLSEVPAEELWVLLFGVFRRLSVEPVLRPAWLSEEELALFLDQLMELAKAGPGRVGAGGRGEVRCD